MPMFNVYGPPGTGKTTYLSHQINLAVSKHGPDGVLVASFSKAAAKELAGRELTINPENVATIHAHCYRALGRPPIAEKNLESWNEGHPSLIMNATKTDLDNPYEEQMGETGGSQAYSMVALLRARLVPRTMWNETACSFMEKWTQWKETHGFVDWTDMVEKGLMEHPVPPGLPKVMFVDEAQDCTALEMKLLKKWAEHTETTVFAGDDDQCIYSFKGASPEDFNAPDVPDDHRRVLNKTYRLSRRVKEYADKLISRIRHRQPKTYEARGEEGEMVRVGDGHWKYPDNIVKRAVEAEGTSMIIASCSYMLTHIIEKMRTEGIRYHNPYRPSNGMWNPLTEQKGRVSMMTRLNNYLVLLEQGRFWKGDELRAWLPMMDSKHLKRGAKERIKMLENERLCGVNELLELMPEQKVQELCFVMEKDRHIALEWLSEHVLVSKKRHVMYPLKVMERGEKEAKITVGTIHSVKGGEADNVFLLPDLSTQGMGEYIGPGRDGVTRVFYVGATRARQRLFLCEPASAYAYSL